MRSISRFCRAKRGMVLILGIALILSVGSNVILIKKIASEKNLIDISSSSIKTVSAQGIYPLFECPCCGKSIDQCTCPMAKERKNYVDFLTEVKSSKDEIILSYVKKYGLDAFINKNKKEEFRKKLAESAPAERPIITIDPSSYDFGNISQKKGKIFTYFNLKNEGKTNLVINKLDTSCGCTFASIVFRGKEGPLFAMAGHGYENPTDWEISISPGETAQLKVMYDPDVHKDFRGTAIREIYVFSSDPIDFKKKVRIELNQVD